MKNKSKLIKRNVITIISIASMLTFTLTNSMFIRETNPNNGFVSNISNEYAAGVDDQGITDYSISQVSQLNNQVMYQINYAESGVWYWDQKKEDYVPKNWTQYAYDTWHYGPEVSLGEYGDDQWTNYNTDYFPTFEIKYIGERPTYEIEHPDNPGLMWNYNDPSGMGDDPDTEDIDESEDDTLAWTETVPDNWPSPTSAFEGGYGGWIQLTPYSPNTNQTYEFRWSNYDSKMTSFPKLKKDWTYVTQYEGSWNQHMYDHWMWMGNDYWRNPVRAETGYANQKVYVDWNISSNEVILDSGQTDIPTTDRVTMTPGQFAANQPKPTSQYSNLQEWEKHSSTAPRIDPGEPMDSENYGVTGSGTIQIGDLPLGWEYNFEADLMYVDRYGNTQQYGETFEDNFSTSKDNYNDDSIDVYWSSIDEDSISFGYDVYDKSNIRVSDVNWVMSGDKGTVYSGTSQSNHFYRTFDVQPRENATFTASYEYSLANDYYGNPISKGSNSASTTGTTSEFYNNTIETFDIWVDNIQANSFVFNYYISTNNNWLPEDAKIEISDGTEHYTLDGIKPGTTSYVVDTTSFDFKHLLLSSFTIDADLTSGSEKISDSVYVNTQTNLIKDLSITILDNNYINNTEASINYVIDTKLNEEDINYIKYSFNDQWYDLDYDFTSDIQELELLNLKENSEYEIYFKVNTDVRDYYSNTFKFKTDRSTKISLPESSTTVGEHSASMTFIVDKWEYLDVVDYTWNVIDRDNEDQVIYQETEQITHDGAHTIYADGLKSDTNYRIVMNAEIEGQTIMLYQDVMTSIKQEDALNNSYLYDVKKLNNSTYEASVNGKVMSAQYSIDNGVTWNKADFEYDENNNKVKFKNIIPNSSSTVSNDGQGITFIVNNQVRSQVTYYDGITTTLIIPKDPIEIDSSKLVLWILIAFIILTMITSTAWAVIYRKQAKEEKTKVEGNIWEQ